MNLDTDWYNCWTCPEKKTSGRTLTKLLAGRCSRDELSEYLDSLTGPQRCRVVVEDSPRPRPELPAEFESITYIDGGFHYRPYLGYLEARRVSREDAAYHRLGLCRSGRYGGRIVFPSFDSEGELDFITGRTVSGGFPTYLTCDSTKDIVFNECLIDWSEPVSVVEGPFDMLAVGRNAIPLQGKMLRTGSRLFERLVSSGVRVNLALDVDAWHDQIAMAHSLYRYCVDVWLVRCDGFKDVSEMGREEFSRRIPLAERYTPMNRLRLLL